MLPLAIARMKRADKRKAAGRGPRPGRAGGEGRTAAEPALRRGAGAGCHRPGHRRQSADSPGGRADRQSRFPDEQRGDGALQGAEPGKGRRWSWSPTIPKTAPMRTGPFSSGTGGSLPGERRAVSFSLDIILGIVYIKKFEVKDYSASLACQGGFFNTDSVGKFWRCSSAG